MAWHAAIFVLLCWSAFLDAFAFSILTIMPLIRTLIKQISFSWNSSCLVPLAREAVAGVTYTHVVLDNIVCIKAVCEQRCEVIYVFLRKRSLKSAWMSISASMIWCWKCEVMWKSQSISPHSCFFFFFWPGFVKSIHWECLKIIYDHNVSKIWDFIKSTTPHPYHTHLVTLAVNCEWLPLFALCECRERR